VSEVERHQAELSPAEIEGFKRRLESQRDDLRLRIRSLRGEVAPPGGDEQTTDDGTLLEEREEALGQIPVAEAQLAQIEKALARIASGTYGVSEVSGRPIPHDRLEALPSATTLVGERVP